MMPRWNFVLSDGTLNCFLGQIMDFFITGDKEVHGQIERFFHSTHCELFNTCSVQELYFSHLLYRAAAQPLRTRKAPHCNGSALQQLQ